MKHTMRWALAALVVAGAAAGGGWWWQQSARGDAVQYRTAKIERGPLQATVSASGAVNPVTQVAVSTQVSGQVRDLFVDFNSEVRAGQLIAQIDPETFEYRVRQSQADLDAARAAVLTAQANAAAARAALSRTRVDLTEAQRDLERKQSLADRQFIAPSEADKARALVSTATEGVKSAEAQVGVTDAQVQSARANVAQREAQLASAQVDLGRTRITSPVNGIVIKRAVERGQTVAASLQAPELFVIAQNLQDMQVDASIDESDVGRIRVGQKASFTVDAFPGQNFEGTVNQVRKAAQNVANVITYVAVIRFANAGERLLPGMTANVRVVTDQRESVLKVPNAALRVRIAGVEPAAPASSPASSPASAPASSPASSPATPASGTSFWQPLWTPRGLVGEAWAQAPGGGAAGGGGGGGGGGMAALRERLAGELKLTDAQLAQLDTIAADMRPRFMALRELPDGERPAAREKLSAEMRSRITAMLTPPQKDKYAQLQAAMQGGSGASASAAAPSAAPLSGSARGTVPTASPATAPSSGAAATGNSAPPAASALPNTLPTPAGGIAPPIQGAGPLVETRNRLVSELRMGAEQAAKLDAIYEAARPRFMTLRDLPAEERGKARERISADVRAQITEILSPAQKQRYAALQAENAGRQATRGRIFVLGEDGKPRAYNVRLGISDGTMTELIVSPNSPEAQVLKEGASVITGVIGATGSGGGGAGGGAGQGARPSSSGPRLPF